MTPEAEKALSKNSIGFWEGVKIVLYLCWLALIARSTRNR